MSKIVYYNLSEPEDKSANYPNGTFGKYLSETYGPAKSKEFLIVTKDKWDEWGLSPDCPFYDDRIPELQPILKELQAVEVQESIYAVKESVTHTLIKDICKKYGYDAQPYPKE